MTQPYPFTYTADTQHAKACAATRLRSSRLLVHEPRSRTSNLNENTHCPMEAVCASSTQLGKVARPTLHLFPKSVTPRAAYMVGESAAEQNSARSAICTREREARVSAETRRAAGNHCFHLLESRSTQPPGTRHGTISIDAAVPPG